MSTVREIYWFILNAASWVIGLGGLIYTVLQFEGAETVMQQTAAGAYGSVFVIFAVLLKLHASKANSDIQRNTPPKSQLSTAKTVQQQADLELSQILGAGEERKGSGPFGLA